MKKYLYILILLIGGTSAVYSQVITITGVVTSFEDKSTLPGVAVVIKGTTKGVVTDYDGNYSIEASVNDILEFSFIGMEIQELHVGNKTNINITMSPESQKIEEVVVTAMGIKREKKALSYATQELSSEKITASSQQDLSKALQGKVAGLNVMQSSGMPGASSQITIRGSNSISLTNSPLVVIDGMPIESGSTKGGSTDLSNRMLDINPDDIETVNILKGPTAAALYGLRASNGVIVITTKSGKTSGAKEGIKTTVTYNTGFSLEQVSRLPNLQSTYAQGEDGQLKLYSPYSWGPRIDSLQPYQSQLEFADTASHGIYDFPQNASASQTPDVYDNMENFFQIGHTYKNSLDISTAGLFGNYSLGFGQVKQEGIIPSTGMEKYTAKFNGTFNLSKRFKTGVAANYSSQRIDKVPSGNNTANPLFTLYSAPRNYDLTNTPYADQNNPYIQRHYRRLMDNPYWAIENNKYYEETERFFGNMNFDYNPFDGVNLTYRVGIDNFNTRNKEVVSFGSGTGRAYPEFGTKKPSGGSIDDLSIYYRGFNSTLLLTVNKKLNDNFKLDVVLGNEYIVNQMSLTEVSGKEILVPGYDNVAVTATRSGYSLEPRRNIGNAYFTTITLDYKGLFYLTPTGRYDIVSNMPEDNRAFFYPSVSTGFIFTNINRLKKNKVLPYGKVRLSYAQCGQTGDPYSTKIKAKPAAHGNSGVSSVYNFPYNGINAFSFSDVLYNNELTPINSKTIELGMELKFLKELASIDYTFYQTRSDGQIYEVPTAASTGNSREYRNAGSVQTMGHEVMLTTKPINKKEKFVWELQFNFSTYNNIVRDLADGIERIAVGDANFTSVGTFAYEGQSYPVIVGTSFVRDADGNIVVDSREMINGSANDRYGMPLFGPSKVLAKVDPDFQLGINNNFTFKRLSFGFMFDWKKGGYMHSGLNALLNAYGMSKETEDREAAYVYDGVKGYQDANGNLVVDGANDIEIKKNKVLYDEVLWNITEADIYKTSYIRLREVTIGYDLPEKWMNNKRIKTARFYLTGRNLWLYTKYPNFDPESSTSSGNGMGGFEFVSLPNARSVGAGLKVTF